MIGILPNIKVCTAAKNVRPPGYTSAKVVIISVYTNYICAIYPIAYFIFGMLRFLLPLQPHTHKVI